MRRRTFIMSVGISGATFPYISCSILPRKYKPKGVIPRKTLGKTGIEVSMLGFGSHLNKELIVQPEKRDKMIKLGFEAGINTFDVYNHGIYKQYEPMGKSVKDFRKEVVISLALTRQTTELVQAAIDDALRKFHTDYIDLARIYTADDGIDRMPVLEKNKTAGKIRAIGIASHDASILMKYIDTYRNTIDYIMIVYNFHHNSHVVRSYQR